MGIVQIPVVPCAPCYKYNQKKKSPEKDDASYRYNPLLRDPLQSPWIEVNSCGSK
jgi:hypothetical protein